MVRAATHREFMDFQLHQAMDAAEAERLGRVGPKVVASSTLTRNVGEKTCKGVIYVNPLGWGPESLGQLPYVLMDYPGALVILPPVATDDADELVGSPLRSHHLQGAGAVLVDIKHVSTPGYAEAMVYRRMQNRSYPLLPSVALDHLSDGVRDTLFQAGELNASALTECMLKSVKGVYPDGFQVHNVEAKVVNDAGGKGTVTILPQNRFEGPEITALTFSRYKDALYGAGSDVYDGDKALGNCFYHICHVLPNSGSPYAPDPSYIGHNGVDVGVIDGAIGRVLENGPAYIDPSVWRDLNGYLLRFRKELKTAQA